MKYQIAIFALLIILIPLLTGCELKPEDHWPVLTAETVSADFTINVTLIEELGIIQFQVANDHADLDLDIRSYNANQGWDVKVILQSIDKYSTNWAIPTSPTSYGESLPMDPSTTRFENIIGEYIDGKPPQGTSRIKFSVYPGWFPTTFEDWVQGSTITDSYVYNYMVIIEDMDGRTDSWEFSISSTLAM
ncbi:MAG: hypothetical protein NTY09_09100 [bacterium]|nr:hypothetical protein [bacterium]